MGLYSISRETFSLDLVCRFVADQLEPSGALYEEIREKVIEYLAKEFVEKNKESVFRSIHTSDIASALEPKIVELLSEKIKEKPNE